MSSETTSPSLSPEAALTLLALPDVDKLSEEQRRGAVCVWGRVRLTAESAIDLGERQLADGRFWFPRADRHCVHRAAMLALQLHSKACGQCAADYRACAEGYGLVRLVRSTGRPS